MTRIDAIVEKIRRELEKRPAILEADGLAVVHFHVYFRGETAPYEVTMEPKYNSRFEHRRKDA